MKNSKKIILIAALTACAMSAAACGPAEEGPADSIEKVTEISDTNETAEVSESEITEAVTTETTAVPAAGSENTSAGSGTNMTAEYPEDSWEYAVMNYYENYNSIDMKKIMGLMLPSDLLERIEKSGRLDAAENDMLSSSINNKEAKFENIRLTKLDEEMPEEARDLFMYQLDTMVAAQDLLESYGNDINAVPEEELNKIVNSLYEDNPDLITDHVYKITECIEIKAEYLKNGEPDYEYYYLYNVEGDGWKIQQSMRKFAENMKNISVRNSAKTLYTNIVTVLFESERAGTTFSESFIISSEDNMNANVPAEFDFSKITDDMYNKDQYHYFAVIENNNCPVTFIWSESEDGGILCGSYPYDQTITVNGKTVDLYNISDRKPEDLFAEMKATLLS